jgi:dipeptidase E
MQKLIIASTSSLHGSSYLEYLLPELEKFFGHAEEILFLPYARPSGISYEAYTMKVKEALSKIGKVVVGIHESSDPALAIRHSKAIFVGGGNTFLLVKTLYDLQLLDVLREVVQHGTAYLGTSAGSNILGMSMQTTNDMPIVYPPSFDTLGLIPFNINPHYLDPDVNSGHMGETRETRIKEFHVWNDIPVIGLREGSWLEVQGRQIMLKGELSARLFRKDKTPVEIETGNYFEVLI